ncbi:MAG TPA: AMP-binding protein, partial [Verrucomicrobiae bacterium]|nr:AMP-binding protein [Verrucomicrobiae bacterium]
MTYRELNERANRLGHYLRSLGVGPEMRVGLCLERSLELTVGLLGILKAGGAYLPLEASYPRERLEFMLADAQVKVLLTQESFAEQLSGLSALTVICMDRDWPQIAQREKTNVGCEVSRENLAYVIYTSGSTGKPKGVLVTNGNVVRLLVAVEQWFGFGPEDAWTFFHSQAFDFSVWEIWGAWAYGGRLVIVPYVISRTPGEFYELLVKEGITILNQTPSAFRQLMAVDEELRRELRLRYIVFG